MKIVVSSPCTWQARVGHSLEAAIGFSLPGMTAVCGELHVALGYVLAWLRRKGHWGEEIIQLELGKAWLICTEVSGPVDSHPDFSIHLGFS